MLNFSRRTPIFGVGFKWDSQKVVKISHLGILTLIHIGGAGGTEKLMTFGPPRADIN